MCVGLLLANPPSLIGTPSCPEELPIASLLAEAVGTRCRASRFCEARATRWLHSTVSLYVRMRICQIALSLKVLTVERAELNGFPRGSSRWRLHL